MQRRAYPLDVAQQLDRQAQKMQEAGRLADAQTLAQRWAQPPAFSAVVEDVRSLWNVGSIFRTADGAGFGCLFLCGITGTPPRKEIAKTSLSAELNVDWMYAPSAAALLPALAEHGCFLLALECTRGINGIADSVPLSQALAAAEIRTPLALIVGNEVSGLSHEVLHAADLICHLPMRGVKESLNVAVAFGIAAYMCSEKLR